MPRRTPSHMDLADTRFFRWLVDVFLKFALAALRFPGVETTQRR